MLHINTSYSKYCPQEVSFLNEQVFRIAVLDLSSIIYLLAELDEIFFDATEAVVSDFLAYYTNGDGIENYTELLLEDYDSSELFILFVSERRELVREALITFFTLLNEMLIENNIKNDRRTPWYFLGSRGKYNVLLCQTVIEETNV